MTKPKVGLFVTCLVDIMRPSVGFAAVKLLEAAGCEVTVPQLQTCCGQPAYNSGDNKDAIAVAKTTLEAFEGFDYVVAPSGSCAGMIKDHYPDLFVNDPDLSMKAQSLSRRTFELISFLVDVMKIDRVEAEYEGKITYHDSCSGLRELGIKDQPRKLLGTVKGLEINEMEDPEVCCGFGGTFCVKYPEISNKMVSDKSINIKESDADTLLAGDLGCLMNMAGKLKREGSLIKVYHVAEILAGVSDVAPLGDGEKR